MKQAAALLLMLFLVLSLSVSSAETLIQLGSTGEAVADLQTMLKTIGLYSGDITGHVGTKTEAAIKAFQSKYGLTPDGIVGEKTLEKLAEVCGKGDSSSTSWISKADVEQVQTMLKALGFYSGEITGNIGTKTDSAIRAFQSKYGLTVDGIPGNETISKLTSVYLQSESASSGAQSVSVETVKTVQTMLKALGYYSGDITGSIGTKTDAAIRAFQTRYGLTVDGIPGTKTMEKLYAVYSGEMGISSSGSSLRYGSSGSEVKTLQENLTLLKYYYGDITGHFGSLTEAAVKAFQRAKGLTADGIAGAKTLDAIASALGTSSGSSASGSTVDLDDSYGRITKDNVYLRSSYSTSSSAVTSLSEGKLVRISKKRTTSAEVWYYITATVGSYTYKGYVRSDMIELISAEEYAAGNGSNGHMETLGQIRITGDNVALRYEPSSSAEKAGTVNSGTIYDYCSTTSGWFQISTGFWVSSSYAEVITSSTSSDSSFGLGDISETIRWMQELLKELGYYYAECTGHFGSKTEAAVKEFQADHGLTADGVVGSKTLAALQSAADETGNTSVSFSDMILDLHWFDEKSFYLGHGVKAGNTITVTDVKTGKSFDVRVQSTGYHADVEPKTAEDTRIMCAIYGVADADDISYHRRSIFVTATVSGVTYTYAASMYGEVHGAQTITDNDYDGQFCIHFRHSTTSETQIEYDVNQDPIDDAVAYAKSLGMTHVTTSSQIP